MTLFTYVFMSYYYLSLSVIVIVNCIILFIYLICLYASATLKKISMLDASMRSEAIAASNDIIKTKTLKQFAFLTKLNLNVKSFTDSHMSIPVEVRWSKWLTKQNDVHIEY